MFNSLAILSQYFAVTNYHLHNLTLKVLVATIDALGHFETG